MRIIYVSNYVFILDRDDLFFSEDDRSCHMYDDSDDCDDDDDNDERSTSGAETEDALQHNSPSSGADLVNNIIINSSASIGTYLWFFVAYKLCSY